MTAPLVETAPCRSCLTARVWARRWGVPVACKRCGAEWLADDRAPVAAPRPAPALEPFVPDPREAAPPALPVGASAEGDMRVLAEWLPSLLGRAAGLESNGGGRPPRHDRSDHDDHHHHGLHHARGVLDRLAALPPDLALGLYAGRARGVLDDVALGLALADAATRRYWLAGGKPGLRDALPRTAGKGTVLAAVAAYEALGADVPTAPHGFVYVLETRADAAVCAMRLDREAAARVLSHAASLRKIAEGVEGAGDLVRATYLRATAQRVVDGYVTGHDAPAPTLATTTGASPDAATKGRGAARRARRAAARGA